MSAWCSTVHVFVCVLALSISDGQNHPIFMSRVAAARQLLVNNSATAATGANATMVPPKNGTTTAPALRPALRPARANNDTNSNMTTDALPPSTSNNDTSTAAGANATMAPTTNGTTAARANNDTSSNTTTDALPPSTNDTTTVNAAMASTRNGTTTARASNDTSSNMTTDALPPSTNDNSTAAGTNNATMSPTKNGTTTTARANNNTSSNMTTAALPPSTNDTTATVTNATIASTKNDTEGSNYMCTYIGEGMSTKEKSCSESGAIVKLDSDLPGCDIVQALTVSDLNDTTTPSEAKLYFTQRDNVSSTEDCLQACFNFSGSRPPPPGDADGGLVYTMDTSPPPWPVLGSGGFITNAPECLFFVYHPSTMTCALKWCEADLYQLTVPREGYIVGATPHGREISREVRKQFVAPPPGICDTLDMQGEAGLETAVISMVLPLNASGAWVEYYTGKFPTQDFVRTDTGAPLKGLEEAVTSGVIMRYSQVIGRQVESISTNTTEDASSSRVTIRHRLVNLEPGESYKVKVRPQCLVDLSASSKNNTSNGTSAETAKELPCEGFALANCVLVVNTTASKGHVCDFMEATDLQGHDQPALVPFMPRGDGRSNSEEGHVPKAESAQICCDMCAAVVAFRPYAQNCRLFTFEAATGRCFLKDATAKEGKADQQGFTSGEVVLV